MELAENTEYLFESFRCNARPLVFDNSLKPHLFTGCSLVNLQRAYTSFNADVALVLVVFDRILDEVEYDELVDPPVGANGQVRPELSHDLDILLPGLNLGFEWLEDFLDLLLRELFEFLGDLILFFLDLHLLDLVRVVIVQQFSRVKDLLGQHIVPMVEFEQVYVVLLLVLGASLRLRILLDLGQDHLGVVQDAIQWGHLLMRVVRLYGVLVQVVRLVLLKLDHLCNVPDAQIAP